MTEHEPVATPRRRFLGRLGATLAAGLGFAAFGGSEAGAAGRPSVFPAPSAEQVAKDTQACLIYCYTYNCSGACCPGYNMFRCVDRCVGTWYKCYQRSCTSFCLSQNAC